MEYQERRAHSQGDHIRSDILEAEISTKLIVDHFAAEFKEKFKVDINTNLKAKTRVCCCGGKAEEDSCLPMLRHLISISNL